MTQKTTVDLIRHGEPVGGVRYRGHKDDPLSETGWTQMRAAVRGETPWQTVVSSPLLRCREFAEDLARRLGVPLIVDDQFREMSFGDWEGLLPEVVQERYPQQLSAYWRDPLGQTPPNAEPLIDFHARVRAAWEKLLDRHASEHLLLVAHGGVIRMILCEVLGIPIERLMSIETPFANRSRVRVLANGKGERWHCLVHHGVVVDDTDSG